ncbi:uncharacterized protein C2845_PM03G33220 [Panicum miliaceum]|uniref:Uncharacterized protein n=1 Tax=Panicum miliaceum TaxID=4540 RepID=A0A3L6T7V2_PANMI|nr:uncharacterized protein C2845_PM03G33220 [Panicum miliaceum]
MERQERDRRRTLLLVSLASVMERADEALLPAVYREVGAALHATPAGLGALTLCRSLVQAASYPLAAYAAARHDRAHVIAAGAFLVGVSDTFVQIVDLLWLYQRLGLESPIFAEIVPERSRTSIYALDRSFEAALSSFAPPIVGILAQRVYGYTPDGKGESAQQDRRNADSLAKALHMAIAVPFIVCASMYSFMYCSYPRDREHARMEFLVESELEQMELDASCLEDNIGQREVLDQVNDGERGAIGAVCDNGELLEADTTKLLSNRGM